MAIKTDKISASTREMSNVMAPPGLISVKQTILKTPKSLFNVGKIPDDRGLYALPTIPDFADISDICQRSVSDFPNYEFSGKWEVHQKLKLEQKCNSISAI